MRILRNIFFDKDGLEIVEGDLIKVRVSRQKSKHFVVYIDNDSATPQLALKLYHRDKKYARLSDIERSDTNQFPHFKVVQQIDFRKRRRHDKLYKYGYKDERDY